MAQSIRIRRTLTPDLAPTGLALGELAAELNSIPPRLWCGVPTTIDPAGRILLNSLGGPFTPDFVALTDAAGVLRSSLRLSERLGANAAPTLLFSTNTAPAPLAGSGTSLSLVGSDTGVTRVNLYGAAPASSVINFFTYRGTLAAPLPLQAGDYMGGFSGYGGLAASGFSGFNFNATEDHTATAQGSGIIFVGTPRGSATGQSGMYYHGDGYLGFFPALPLGPPPATPGHAPGARITLLPDVAGGYDYAIGMAANHMWFGAPSGGNYRFYNDATPQVTFGNNRLSVFGNAPNGPSVNFYAYRGTFAAPMPLQQHDVMGGFWGYATFAGSTGGWAGLVYRASEDHSDTAQGTYIEFETTPRGATAGQRSLAYHGDGSLIFAPFLPLGPPPPTPGHAPGSRIILYPGSIGGQYDYAIGMDAGAMWFGIDNGGMFRWFNGAAAHMSLDALGALRMTIEPPPDDNSDRVATTAWVRGQPFATDAAVRELTSRVEVLEAALGTRTTGVGK